MTPVEFSSNWHAGVKAVARFGAKGKRAVDKAMQKVAQQATELLRANISSGKGVASLSAMTIAKRTLGKTQGTVNPPIKAYGGTTPLSRSGRLARAVAMEKRKPRSYFVGFLAGVFSEYSGGRQLPVAVIAELLEFGFTVVQPITKYMQTYLRVLAGDKITPNPGQPNAMTGRVLSVRVAARPFFSSTFYQLRFPSRELATKTFFEAIGLGGDSK